MIGDTDFFIDLTHSRRPGHAAAAAMAQRVEGRGERIAMTVVTRVELQAGVAQFVRPEEERSRVQGLLAAYPTYSLDGAAADRAGAIHGGLRAQGKSIGILDAIIAAIVLERAEGLLTRNEREFSRVAGLRVVPY